ncbi:MAG: hypothetical protein AB9869_06165 [Verrucomicrobiia bacterium]
MKGIWRNGKSLWGLAIVALLWTGCASTPKVDWASRVGNYTYDQAILELGPPDKVAELSDGSVVADWISRARSDPALTVGLGTGFYGHNSAFSLGQSVGTVPSARQLRLTFGPDKRLTSWSGRYP